MDKQKLKLTSCAFIIALILLFSVNIFSQYFFTNLRIDLTKGKLYTLSKGTKNILKNINEPINLQFYFSSKLAEDLPGINSYAIQIRELLEEYTRIANGKINLEIIDPEPFSEQEDIAISYGLQGVPINDNGTQFYLGLVGSNSTDLEKIIPFFKEQRESSLEHDITQLVYQLLHPEKPKIAIISSLPIQGQTGNFHPQAITSPWNIWQHLEQIYDVEFLPFDINQIDEKFNLLILIAPREITEKTIYAIDQFIMAGGHLLAFLDTFVESDLSSPIVKTKDIELLNKLIKNFGVTIEPEKTIADSSYAKQVWYTHNNRQITTEFPFWQEIPKDKIANKDLVTNNLDIITIASPGYFKIENNPAIELTTLIKSSKQAAEFNVKSIEHLREHPEEVLRNYQSNNKEYIYALRINGQAKSAFPNGINDQSQKAHLTQSIAPLNIILVSDADLLNDRFWLKNQLFLGQTLKIPMASNGVFALNAIDNLTGSADLIEVRSRVSHIRPFTKLREMQKQAEIAYRSKEQELLKQLQAAEERLAKLNDHKVEENRLILSEAQRQEIEKFRKQQVNIRKELRQVRNELQKNIKYLTAKIKFINIGLVPMLVGIAGIAFSLYRKRKQLKR